MRARWLFLGSALAPVALGACGGGDDGGGAVATAGSGTAGSGDAALQLCYQVCEAQQVAEEAGMCPGIGLSICKAICDGSMSGSCWDQLTALNRCGLTGNYGCSLFSAESDADCQAEIDAYTTCAADG